MAFTREVTASRDGDTFSFHCVSFADKLVLNVVVNGVVDTTFDIPLSTRTTINTALAQEEALGVEPVVLMGNPNNLKLQVVAAQIGKVVAQLAQPRNVILGLSLRWFGKDDEPQEGDFGKLMFVLEHVRTLLAEES